MPKEISGKSGECAHAEYVFRMVAYMSTVDPAGKGGEVVRVTAIKERLVDEETLRALESVYWNVQALNSALASCLISTTTGEVGTLVRRVLQAALGASLRAW